MTDNPHDQQKGWDQFLDKLVGFETPERRFMRENREWFAEERRRQEEGK